MAEGEKKTWRERYNEARENMKHNKLVQHVRDNPVPYASLGSAVLSGVLVSALKSRPINVEVAPVINNTVNPVIKPVVNNVLNNNVGPLCKVVQDLDNPDRLWPKITKLAQELAEEHNATENAVRVMLSRHFRGELPDVFGGHYRPYASTTG